jgi:hypothetical protein
MMPPQTTDNGETNNGMRRVTSESEFSVAEDSSAAEYRVRKSSLIGYVMRNVDRYDRLVFQSIPSLGR